MHRRILAEASGARRGDLGGTCFSNLHGAYNSAILLLGATDLGLTLDEIGMIRSLGLFRPGMEKSPSGEAGLSIEMMGLEILL